LIILLPMEGSLAQKGNQAPAQLFDFAPLRVERHSGDASSGRDVVARFEIERARDIEAARDFFGSVVKRKSTAHNVALETQRGTAHEAKDGP
jgi:hypothetical protein